MNAPDPKNTLKAIIGNKIALAEKQSLWAGGFFQEMRKLQPDLRGEVGEEFIADVLAQAGYSVEVNRETDPTRKHWDVRVSGTIKLEVKTATLGADGRTFQHENFEKDRDYDAVVLVDVAPNDLYLTVAPKDTLPFTRQNDNWTRNPKQMHRRRHGIAYKWDLHLRDVESRKVETLDDIKQMFAPVLGSVDNNS